MGSGFQSSDDEVISGINITPLVDVVLVILVIFLITAPVIYQSAIKVQLPSASSGEENKKSPLTFTITREGKVMWEDKAYEWNELEDQIRARKDSFTDETAVINADTKAEHGTVVQLMDILRKNGLMKFALSVQSERGK